MGRGRIAVHDGNFFFIGILISCYKMRRISLRRSRPADGWVLVKSRGAR